MTIEELKVLITAETAGLEREINKVQGQLRGFEKNVSRSTNRINSSFKNLFRGVSFTAITLGLIKVGKTASKMASDLEEVQNVVQVTFGDATNEINEFASNALKAYGLNELSAKRMASTYMAMSNGMGIAQETGKEMSKTLTGLAGDMASFYNVSSDVADTALHSVFTGETETLKKFGVVMTEANLQAFAFSQGINKQVREMSQAEKVMLRYNYVIKTTAQAQGDFSRTSGTWANQTRILKEQWSQLLGILGRGLNAVLLPVVKAMNNLLSSVIAVANSMSKAFGGSGIASATGKVESNIGGIQDGIGGVEGGFDDANESAKKLAKTVAGFDELNILSKPDAGGSGGGLGDLGGITEGEGTITPTPDEEGGVSKLQHYLQECKDIIDKWTSTIPKLEIHFDKEKALEDLASIGKNVLNTIAGWGSFAITIAINIANDLDIGKLTNDFLSLVEAVTGFASSVTDVLVPALEGFYESSGLSSLVEWLGGKLSDGLQLLTDEFNKWSEWFSANSEEIIQFFEDLGTAISPLTELVKLIGNVAWTVFSNAVKIAGEALRVLLDKLLEFKDIGMLVGYALDIFVIGKLLNAIVGFHGLLTYIKATGKILPYFTDLVKAPFQMLSGSIMGAFKHFKVVFSAILKTILTGIKFIITNPIGLIITAIVGLVALIAVKGDEIQGVFNKISDYLKNVFATDWTKQFGAFGEVMNGFGKVFGDVWNGISEILNGIIDFIRGVFTGDWKRAWGGIKSIFKGIWDGLVGVVKAPINIIIGLANGLGRAIVSAFNSVKRIINTLHLRIPDWVPLFGGKSIGFNLKMSSFKSIPLLANGGVIDSPTVAMMGEYAGAKSNPEIVAPQSILRDTINESNADMISAMYQMCRQVISAIEGIDMEVSIGDEIIAQSAKRGNIDYQRRTGKPLFA